MSSYAYKLPIIREFTGDRLVDKAQQNAAAAAQRANTSTATNVRRTAATTFTAGGSVRIVHGLPLPEGGVPIGWRVSDVTGGYGSFQRTAWDDTTITIQSANACTAIFEVFS